MKLVVLAGGRSPEREVSLSTGEGIVEALRASGHEVIVLDPQDALDLGADLRKADADAVFIALHGGAGEDGRVQALLDLLEIPYTGSGHLGCALAMDKLLSKELFVHAGIPTPPWLVSPVSVREIEAGLGGFPVVVKPARQGSTVGVTLVHSATDLDDAVRRAESFGDVAIVERFIPGREMAVGVLGGDSLPVVEIRPSHEIYDYECKYTAGMSEYEVPAPLTDAQTGRLRLLALEAHGILRLSAYSRVDFRLDPQGRPWCLEANALPGMTPTSLLPKAAAAAGLSFPVLCERIVDFALVDRPRVGTPAGRGG